MSLSNSISSPPSQFLSHPGLANLGNTCFLNSLIQALNASSPFAKIIHQINHPLPLSSLLSPSNNPSLISELDSLLSLLNSQSATLRPLPFLNALGARHRDYLRKEQQDAHEFLHILRQLIRAEQALFSSHLQNLSHNHHPSLLPNPDPSQKPSPNLEPTATSSSSASSARSFPLPTSTFSAASSASSSSSIEPPTQHTNQPVPFLDSIFTGSLTQYTVCENLHVSSLPEEFLDLSLATTDISRNTALGKRARLRKHIQNRLRGPSTAKLHLALQPAPISPSIKQIPVPLPRRSSLSNSERPSPSTIPRRASLDSCRDVNFCSPRIAFWGTAGLPTASHTSEPSPLKLRFGSKASLRLGRPTKDTPSLPNLQSPTLPTHTEAHKTYVRMILAETTKTSRSLSPLRALRFPQSTPRSQSSAPGSNSLVDSQDTGLHALLRKFTSIDVLEGENRFACKDCWKHASRSLQPVLLPQTPTTLFRKSSSSSMRSGTSSQPGSLLSSPVVVRGDMGPTSPAFNPALEEDESWEEIPTIRIVSKSNAEYGEVGSEARWLGSSSGQDARVVSEESTNKCQPGSSLGLYCGSPVDRPSPTTLSGRPEAYDSSAEPSEADGSGQPLESTSAPQQQAFGERLRASLRRSTTTRERAEQQQQPAVCRAFKRYLFAQLPEVLVVHLKRFEPVFKATGAGMFGTGVAKRSGAEWNKLEDVITFPERLDMTPFVVPELQKSGGGGGGDEGSGENVYGLVSVVVHKGQAGGGHYVAYVLSSRTSGAGEGKKEWVYCSDSETRVVEKKEVLESQAYLLIYEK